MLVRAIVTIVFPLLSTIGALRITLIAAKYYSGVNAEQRMRFAEQVVPSALPGSEEAESGSNSFPMVHISRRLPRLDTSPKNPAEKKPNIISRNIRHLSQKMGSILGGQAHFLTKTKLSVLVAFVGAAGIAFFVLSEISHVAKPHGKFCGAITLYGLLINTACICIILVLYPIIFYSDDTYGICVELCCLLTIWTFGLLMADVIPLTNLQADVQISIRFSLFICLSIHWVAVGAHLLEVVFSLCCGRNKTESISMTAAIEACEDLTSMDWEDFRYVLETPELLSELTLFAVREFAVENLLFYRRIELLKRMAGRCQFAPNNSEYSQSIEREILAIYNEFIAEGSENELNIMCSTREGIKNAMLDGKKGIYIFDKANEETLMLVFQNTFPRYLQQNL